MHLIVGLGNPGKKYENTRHNLGFIAVDRLAESLGISIDRNKFQGLMGISGTGDDRIVLLKPQTFMNESGRSVKEAMDFYKVEPKDLLVIYDDFDIETGTIRLRAFGSAGTHNGMRSIISCTGTDRFPRIRIGTGVPDLGERDLIKFVLSGFSKEEVPLFEKAVDSAVKAAGCYVEKGIDTAMNRYNTRSSEKIDG